MKPIPYKQIFLDAFDENHIAGFFQNPCDISKACQFAKKEGFDIEDSQELRSLKLEKDGRIFLIFLLRLKDGSDIAVFHRGKVRVNKYVTNMFQPRCFLSTTPVKIMTLKEAFE